MRNLIALIGAGLLTGLVGCAKTPSMRAQEPADLASGQETRQTDPAPAETFPDGAATETTEPPVIDAFPPEPEPVQPKDLRAEPAPEPEPTVYVVRRGDTLYGLAERYLGSGKRWKEIAEINDIDDPAKLYVGTKLKIPAK